MRTIFLLFDSLNRSALGAYGGKNATPNFDRLAEKSAVFDNHYIGSMPCMPARRDIHTGRLNFLHRSWGPLEPFDDSFVVKMRENGVYTHLTSDHVHYWEDGGATYHNRYNTWDCIRGQEDDCWAAMVNPPVEEFRKQYHERQFGGERANVRIQGMINETRIKAEADFPLTKCFDSALDFLDQNGAEDDWLLHLECFDPHEPFTAPERFRHDFPTDYQGPTYNWPQYRKSSDDTPEEIAEVRANYMALVAFCDEQLGRLLDYLDDHDMWRDTAIVMTTDHGFMLNEHDWWGKLRMPHFNELANIPLMIHDPRTSLDRGSRVDALTQVIDLAPTLLDLFGISPCEFTLGASMLPLLRGEADKIRDLALFGVFGGAINATDGKYTYFLYPDDMEEKPLFEYTLMPMHSTSMFTVSELADAELSLGFDFTKGVPVLKIPARKDAKRPPMQGGGFSDVGTRLYDVEVDPRQNDAFRDPEIEAMFCEAITREMRRQDAPAELFERFGLTAVE